MCTQAVLSSGGTPPATSYVTRIAFEIGYHEGDLPGMIRTALEKRGMAEDTRDLRDATLQVLHFNETNEYHRTTDEEILFYYDPGHPRIKGERVLQTTLENQHVPHSARYNGLDSVAAILKPCTHLEVSFDPSALEYLFPHADHQRLFNATEMDYLRSPRSVTVDYWVDVKEFIHQIGRARRHGITIRGARARIACYEGGTRLINLDLYDGGLVAESGESFSCPGRMEVAEGYPARFKELASEVRPYSLRVRCADNLRDLYNRFRLYSKAPQAQNGAAEAGTGLGYPASDSWCDAVTLAFGRIGMLDRFVAKPFKCPSAGEGRCHYAMNPDCKYDSPGDVVLLFETRAGWNQHGGPELFAFDNHDPRGGCVLLNDGTVRFVRTPAELRELRWK